MTQEKKLRGWIRGGGGDSLGWQRDRSYNSGALMDRGCSTAPVRGYPAGPSCLDSTGDLAPRAAGLIRVSSPSWVASSTNDLEPPYM